MLWAGRNQQKLVRDGITQIYPRLYRYCLVLTSNPSAADDLVQSACLRALERAEQFKAGTHFDRWIFTITHRLWVDELRKNAVRSGGGLANIDEVNLVDHKPDPENSLLNREVIDSVFKLPEAQRVTVLLVLAEGYSYRDAAEVLGIPIGTVMSRLAAARGKLVQVYFEKQELDDVR